MPGLSTKTFKMSTDIAIQTTKPQVLPEWLDTDEYPFEDKSIFLIGLRIHYLDEGQGQVILFGHAACVWSFH